MTLPRSVSTWLLASLALAGSWSFVEAQEVPAVPEPERPIVAVQSTADTADDQEVAGGADRDLVRLRRRLEENWRVVPVRDGLVLVPRRPGRDVRGVELRGGTVALDGVPATGDEVRRRLGSDADAILTLSYLAPEDHARLWSAERVAPGRVAEGARRQRPSSAEEWRRRGDRVRIGGNVTVQEGERVDQVVTIFGSSTIRGEVRGDVVAVFGNIRLEPTARVQGDVTAVGGQIDAAPGAQFQGGNHQVSLNWPHVRITPFWAWPGWPDDHALAWLTSAATFSRMLLVFLVVVAAVALAPARMARVADVVDRRLLAAFGIGLAAQVVALPLLPAVTLALLISIVGIPLLALLPVLIVAGLLFWVGGFAGTMVALGRRLTGRGSGEAGVGSAVLGLALLWVVTIAARLWWLAVGTASGPVLVASAVGVAIEFIAWSIGLGAAFLAWREGRRTRYVVTPAPVPQTPPAPVGL